MTPVRIKVSKEDDERFERELPHSLAAVDAVERLFKWRGYETLVSCDRKYVDRWSYKDRPGDLIIWKNENDKKKVEVKGRRLQFTCSEDFPYQTIIVDRANKKSGFCDYYVTVNIDLSYAAVINLDSKNDWVSTKISDNKRGYTSVPVFMCPKGKAFFVKIPDNPNQKSTPLPINEKPTKRNLVHDDHMCFCGAYGCFGDTKLGNTEWRCSKHIGVSASLTG